MTPGTYDLVLYRGDTFTVRFVLWEDTTKAEPIDLSGSSVTAQWRDSSLRVHDFAVTVTAPNIVDVELAAADWVDVPGSGAWDLQTEGPEGVRTFVAGRVDVTGDITRVTA